jgi:hypothetical protein
MFGSGKAYCGVGPATRKKSGNIHFERLNPGFADALNSRRACGGFACD